MLIPPLLQKGDYIYGSFIKPEMINGYIKSSDPSNKDVLIGQYLFSYSSVSQAIAYAKASHPQWQKKSIENRTIPIQKLQEDIVKNHQFITKTISLESGLPLHEASSEVNETILFLQYLIDASPSILDKIQQKNYVKKGNIKHKPIQIQTFILKEKNIDHKSNKDYIYEEKNKLYITETGKKVIEFCYKYYEHLFNYTYTSKMESILDQIEYEEKDWKPIFKLFKEEVDKEVSIEEIKAKQESLHCGKYKNKLIIIKKGQFGYYVEYDKKKTSLLQWEYYDNIDEYIKNHCFPEDKIETLIQFCNIIHINENISIRKSKHGEYIYYKTKTMRKPKFYPLNIESRNIEDIKNYIEKNYKSIL